MLRITIGLRTNGAQTPPAARQSVRLCLVHGRTDSAAARGKASGSRRVPVTPSPRADFHKGASEVVSLKQVRSLT